MPLLRTHTLADIHGAWCQLMALLHYGFSAGMLFGSGGLGIDSRYA